MSWREALGARRSLARFEQARDIEAGTDGTATLEDMSLDELLDALVEEAKRTAKTGQRPSDLENAIYDHITGRY